MTPGDVKSFPNVQPRARPAHISCVVCCIMPQSGILELGSGGLISGVGFVILCPPLRRHSFSLIVTASDQTQLGKLGCC